MGNLDTPSEIGKNNQAGADLARFKVKFSGMVLAAFKRNNIMRQFVWEKDVRGSKAASFPAVGLATSALHAKMKNIFLDDNDYLKQIKVNDIIVYPDRPMFAATAVDLVDDLMSDDIRLMHLADALGESLARDIDRKILNAAVLGARADANITATSGYETIPGGVVLEEGANVATTASNLLAAIQKVAQKFDEHDVTMERYVILRPEHYHLLLGNTTILGAEYGRQERVEGRALDVHGVKILKSNNLPTTNILDSDGKFGATGNGNVYYGDFSDTVGLAIAGRQALGGAILRDITTWTEFGDEETFAHKLKVDFIGGFHAIRPECLIEISKAEEEATGGATT